MADLPSVTKKKTEKPAPAGPRTVQKVLTEIPTYSFTGFDTLDSVKAAVRRLEQGYFDMATQLVEAMTRDERINTCLMLRTRGIDVLPMEFEEGPGTKGAGVGTSAASDVMTEVRENWSRFYPEAELAKMRKWARMNGIAIGENRWEYNAETQRMEPRFHCWHPRWLWWNWATRSYWMTAMEGTVELVAGTGQWVLYAPDGLYMAWMTGLVRTLYVPWLLRQWSLRDSGRYSEAFGAPTKKARFPAGINDEQRDKYMADVARLASESVIGLPAEASEKEPGYDVEFIELTGTGGDLFEKMINLANTNLAVGIVGNNLTVEIQGGSYSAVQVHSSIRGDILQSDCNSLSECLRTQSLEFYALYNFGDRQLAPKAKWNTEPPEDKKAAGEALKAAGEGLKAVVLSGLPVDAQKFSERFGIPLRDDATDDEKIRPRIIDPLLVALGIPNVNEAREIVGGWDAATGGDEIPKVNPDPPPDPVGAAPKKKEAKMSDVPVPTVEGQLYVDKLGEAAVKDAQKARHREMVMLLAAVESAKDFDELKAFLTKAYAKADDTDLAEILRKALLLSEYAGRDFAQAETA